MGVERPCDNSSPVLRSMAEKPSLSHLRVSTGKLLERRRPEGMDGGVEARLSGGLTMHDDVGLPSEGVRGAFDCIPTQPAPIVG